MSTYGGDRSAAYGGRGEVNGARKASGAAVNGSHGGESCWREGGGVVEGGLDPVTDWSSHNCRDGEPDGPISRGSKLSAAI